MAFIRKIKAGLVQLDREEFVGEDGNIFFDIDTGQLYLSDGVTPGGFPITSGGSGSSNLVDLDDVDTSLLGNNKVPVYNSLTQTFQFKNYVSGGSSASISEEEFVLSGTSYDVIFADNNISFIVSYYVKDVLTNEIVEVAATLDENVFSISSNQDMTGYILYVKYVSSILVSNIQSDNINLSGTSYELVYALAGINTTMISYYAVLDSTGEIVDLSYIENGTSLLAQSSIDMTGITLKITYI